MNKNVNNQPETAPVAAAKSPLRRPLIVLLSVFIVLCLLTGTLAVFTFVDFSDDGGDTPGTTTGFDYYATLLSSYLEIRDGMFTGITLPGFESRVDEVNEENVKKYINQLLLDEVDSFDAEGNQLDYTPMYTKPIDYADEVFLYVLRVEKENGEHVDVNFFENAYLEAGRIQMGMEYFGKDFDDKLIALGLAPVEIGSFERRTSGTVDADDVVLMSYTVTETVKATEEGKADEVKNHKNRTSERVVLAEKDAAWLEKLLASYGAVGQYFFFEYEEDIDEDGDVETVKYEGMIDAVIEDESWYELTATLPKDYFGKAPTDERFAELNGATLTFHISVLYSVPREANTADTLTLDDIAILNNHLINSGVAAFVPSGNTTSKADEDGAMTALDKEIKTLKNEITKTKNEIETLKGDIAKIEGEIAALEAEITALEAAIATLEAELAVTPDDEKSEELTAKKNTLNNRNDSLASKQKALKEKNETLVPPIKEGDETAPLTKEETLAEMETGLATAEAKLEASLVTARKECLAYFTAELAKTYDQTVRYTAGELVLDHLLDTLSFTALPESEVELRTDYYTQMLNSSYVQLSDYEKRDYRDIDQFAANGLFGYDEKEYKTAAAYIEARVAREIKYSLLVCGIYNTFINDESKFTAKSDEIIAKFIEYVKVASSGKTLFSKEEATSYYPEFSGSSLKYDTTYELVIDYLADNNTIDWDTAKNQEK